MSANGISRFSLKYLLIDFPPKRIRKLPCFCFCHFHYVIYIVLNIVKTAENIAMRFLGRIARPQSDVLESCSQNERID